MKQKTTMLFLAKIVGCSKQMKSKFYNHISFSNLPLTFISMNFKGNQSTLILMSWKMSMEIFHYFISMNYNQSMISFQVIFHHIWNVFTSCRFVLPKAFYIKASQSNTTVLAAFTHPLKKTLQTVFFSSAIAKIAKYNCEFQKTKP